MLHPPLEQAAAAAGLDARGARLLHARANAVYLLPRPGIVVRLRHTRGSLEWQRRLACAVSVARWLNGLDFPAVAPLDLIQPVTINGWSVTFWRYEVFNESLPDPSPADLARLLRQLHDLPAPPFDLPITDPLGALPADLNHAGDVLSDEQRDWLRQRVTDVASAYPSIDIPTSRGLIHGDAHTGNLFPVGTRYLLGDWDSVSAGPRAQDLVPTLDGVRHFGSLPADWHAFCRAYGIDPDIKDHPGIQTLCQARELRSLAAYIRAADRPEVAAELAKRIHTLMTGDNAVWRAL